jgi:hypothetical protein
VGYAAAANNSNSPLDRCGQQAFDCLYNTTHLQLMIHIMSVYSLRRPPCKHSTLTFWHVSLDRLLTCRCLHLTHSLPHSSLRVDDLVKAAHDWADQVQGNDVLFMMVRERVGA